MAIYPLEQLVQQRCATLSATDYPAARSLPSTKIVHVAQERFKIANMAYTQLFVDYLYAKDPYTFKYFDECGACETSLKQYSKVWSCTDWRKGNRSNKVRGKPLQLIFSVFSYWSNLHEHSWWSGKYIRLQFFEEAYNSLNPVTLRPCLEVGDTIVMDNCPMHHHQGGRILQEFLDDLNIE